MGRKIIQILHHSPSVFNLNIDDAWHVKLSKQILMQSCDYEYKIECWQPEKTIRKVYTEERDGITIRSFPSIYLRYGREYPLHLLKALKNPAKKEEIIIHLHDIHNHLVYLISHFMKDVPIVAQHHGSANPLFLLRNSKHPLRFVCLLDYCAEKQVFKNIDHFLVLTEDEKNYLSKIVGSNKVEIQTMGVDFDEFRPLDKRYARKALGLPMDKRIIIHVGRLNKAKGADVVIKAFQKIKQKNDDVELIMIGNLPIDPLYAHAKAIGAKVFRRVPQSDLIFYYNAADVYAAYPTAWALSTGTSGLIGPVEALACGVPVVSTTLRHFTTNEQLKVGKIPKNEGDIARCISDIFDNPTQYKDCREIARKYYDWTNIVLKTTILYKNLFEDYYKNC